MRVFHWNGRAVLEAESNEEQEFILQLLKMFENSRFTYGPNTRYDLDLNDPDVVAELEDSG